MLVRLLQKSVLVSLVAGALFVDVARSQPAAGSGTIISIAGSRKPGGPSGDGGPATNAVLAAPLGLAISRDGTLHFDELTDAISAVNFRSINPSNGIINTIASSSASAGLGMDRVRHKLYFPNFNDAVVDQIDLANNSVSLFAGVGWFYPFPQDDSGNRGDGGPANEAWFSTAPWAISSDGAGNVFIAEGSRIRKVTIETGIITTICGLTDTCCGGLSDVVAFSGDGGPASNATLVAPYYLTSDRAGDLFILDLQSSGARYIRRIDAATGIINTIAGVGTESPATAGPAVSKSLADLQSIAVNDAGTELFLGGLTRVYRIDLVTGILAPYAGNGTNGFSGAGGPALHAEFGNNGISGLLVPPGGGLLISDYGNETIWYVAPNSITLTNAPGLTEFHLPWVNSLDGDLIVTNNPDLTLVEVGSLTNVTGSVIFNANNNSTAGIVDLGALTSTGGSVTVTNTGIKIFNAGSLTTVSGNVDISDNPATTVVDLGSLTNVCGDIIITNNAPDVTVDLNNLTDVGGCSATPVTMTVDGSVTATNGMTIETNATLAGSATVDGSVINNGTISPGSSPGHLGVLRNLVLKSSSRLRMEIGGYAADAFDSVSVGGALALDGNLSVSLIDDFPNVMTNGASFTILTAAEPITGAFANVASGGQLKTTDGRARFTVNYAGQNSVTLADLVILDSDGDGASDEDELAAGTDPHNAASLFHILSVLPEGGDVRLTWSVVGGKNYVVQTNSQNLVGGFGDFSPLIAVPGSGEATTNLLDTGALGNFSPRFYRVRLGP